jgi:acylphosphatase
MSRWEGISPKAIGERLREGIRRNAFRMKMPPGVRPRAVAEAQRLGLLGWLSTSDAESVQGLVEGSIDAIEAFFDWCLEHGPDGAIPAAIDVTSEDEDRLSTFRDVDSSD